MKIQNEEAVSPVIGVILMVAITVILAAVIAAFVFGMAGTTQTTKTIGMTVGLNQSVDEAFQITFTGGADIASLSYLTVNRDGAPVEGFTVGDGTTAGDICSPPGESTYSLVAKDGPDDNRIIPDDANSNGKFNVGQVILVNVGATVSGSRITIIGTFTDGGTQILYDRSL